MVKRGDLFKHKETEEVLVFHHYRPLSRWSSFRKQSNNSIVHLPPPETLSQITDWKSEE